MIHFSEYEEAGKTPKARRVFPASLKVCVIRINEHPYHSK